MEFNPLFAEWSTMFISRSIQSLVQFCFYFFNIQYILFLLFLLPLILFDFQAKFNQGIWRKYSFNIICSSNVKYSDVSAFHYYYCCTDN